MLLRFLHPNQTVFLLFLFFSPAKKLSGWVLIWPRLLHHSCCVGVGSDVFMVGFVEAWERLWGCLSAVWPCCFPEQFFVMSCNCGDLWTLRTFVLLLQFASLWPAGISILEKQQINWKKNKTNYDQSTTIMLNGKWRFWQAITFKLWNHRWSQCLLIVQVFSFIARSIIVFANEN